MTVFLTVQGEPFSRDNLNFIIREYVEGAKIGAVRVRKSSPAWETNLENNLVEEGLRRSKARELVRLAAS
jgi:hypothetical protein